MAKIRKRQSPNGASLGSLVKSMGLLKAEMRIGNQEIQAGLTQVQEEMRTGFDQMYRHIDGFVIRIYLWHLEQVRGSAS